MTPTQTQPAAGERTVVHNARLLDPSVGRDETGGILIEDGAIADIGTHVTADAAADAIDCSGRFKTSATKSKSPTAPASTG